MDQTFEGTDKVELSSTTLSWKAPKEERTIDEDWDEQRCLPRYFRGNSDVMVQAKVLTSVCVCVFVCVVGG